MAAGCVRITDLIDLDPASVRYCGHSIGRAIECSDGRWVFVQRIERVGDVVYGLGRLIGAAQAEKVQARWDVRWGFRVAPAVHVEANPDRAPKSSRMPKFADVDGAAAAIVAIGYRELAKKHHPDAGGDHQSMSLLTQAHRQLKQILEMAKG